jgi:hypothetical protein
MAFSKITKNLTWLIYHINATLYFTQKAWNFSKYLELLNIPADSLKLTHFSIVPTEELAIILKNTCQYLL